MNLSVLNTAESICSQRANWDSVAGPNPFFSHAWMSNWLRYQGTELEPCVLVATDNHDQWIGVAPWCIETTATRSRKLRFLGSGHACTDYNNLFAIPGYFRQFAEVAARWLNENSRGRGELGNVDSIELDGMSAECDRAEYVRQQIRASGFSPYRTKLESCWVVDLPDSWDQLNSTFSRSLRRKTKRAVSRIDSREIQIVSTDHCPLDDLWPWLVHLHQKRRKMLGQGGCFGQVGFDQFLKAAVSSLIKDRRAELVQVTYRKQPMASMLLLNDGKTVYMYQSGMEPELMSLEPGYIVIAHALQSSIAKGFLRFDFLRGDEPYKARWNTRRHELTKDKFVPQAISAKLKHQIWLTGKTIKSCAQLFGSAAKGT